MAGVRWSDIFYLLEQAVCFSSRNGKKRMAIRADDSNLAAESPLVEVDEGEG